MDVRENPTASLLASIADVTTSPTRASCRRPGFPSNVLLILLRRANEARELEELNNARRKEARTWK
jgi:hypothetical protein